MNETLKLDGEYVKVYEISVNAEVPGFKVESLRFDHVGGSDVLSIQVHADDGAAWSIGSFPSSVDAATTFEDLTDLLRTVYNAGARRGTNDAFTAVEELTAHLRY